MKQAPRQVHTGTNAPPGTVLTLRRLAAAYLACSCREPRTPVHSCMTCQCCTLSSLGARRVNTWSLWSLMCEYKHMQSSPECHGSTRPLCRRRHGPRQASAAPLPLYVSQHWRCARVEHRAGPHRQAGEHEPAAPHPPGCVRTVAVSGSHRSAAHAQGHTW